MTRTCLNTVLLLLLAFHTHAQTYSTLIPDSEINAFMRAMIRGEDRYDAEPRFSRKKIVKDIVPWTDLNFTKPDSLSDYSFQVTMCYLFGVRDHLDTLFTEADRQFFIAQKNSIKDSIWHKAPGTGKLLAHAHQFRPNRHHYSLPVFSADRNYAIVYKQYHCGSLCAYGGYYIYRKMKDGKWEFVRSVNTWVS